MSYRPPDDFPIRCGFRDDGGHGATCDQPATIAIECFCPRCGVYTVYACPPCAAQDHMRAGTTVPWPLTHLSRAGGCGQSVFMSVVRHRPVNEGDLPDEAKEATTDVSTD